MSENRLFLSGEENRYSSAVARGPLDHFNSKIPRAQFFFYIISYFGFIFTIRFCFVLLSSAYCRTLLSCTRFAVVYSARQRLVNIALWVIARGAWWANTCIGLPAKLTTGAIYNQVEAVIGRKARHSLRIEILPYPTCIRRPRSGGCHRNIAMPFGIERLEWCGRRPFPR